MESDSKGNDRNKGSQAFPTITGIFLEDTKTQETRRPEISINTVMDYDNHSRHKKAKLPY